MGLSAGFHWDKLGVETDIAIKTGDSMKPTRSNLSVSGHRMKMHAKALGCEADVVMFDLEDSVPPEQKELARKTVITTLDKVCNTTKTIRVRVNAVDTPFAYKDIIEVAGRSLSC